MPIFRILHASDFHISRVPNRIGVPDLLNHWTSGSGHVNINHSFPVSTFDWNILDAFAAYLHYHGDEYDLIVLSGDLAATGTKNDISVAGDFIYSPASNGYLTPTGKPTISRFLTKLVLLPGNHDRFGPLLNYPPYPPGDKTFDLIFKNHWSVGQNAQPLWIGTKGTDSLALIGADLTLKAMDFGTRPLQLGHLGQGRAYQICLQQLINETQIVRKNYANCAIVWVIHFEPQCLGSRPDPCMSLVGDAQFNRAVHLQGVIAVLCGHTHTHQVKRLPTSNTALFVCGTTSQYYAPTRNCFLSLDFDLTSLQRTKISHRVYYFDAIANKFQ